MSLLKLLRARLLGVPFGVLLAYLALVGILLAGRTVLFPAGKMHGRSSGAVACAMHSMPLEQQVCRIQLHDNRRILTAYTNASPSGCARAHRRLLSARTVAAPGPSLAPAPSMQRRRGPSTSGCLCIPDGYPHQSFWLDRLIMMNAATAACLPACHQSKSLHTAWCVLAPLIARINL